MVFLINFGINDIYIPCPRINVENNLTAYNQQRIPNCIL